jgi:site-specific recombinase XerC
MSAVWIAPCHSGLKAMGRDICSSTTAQAPASIDGSWPRPLSKLSCGFGESFLTGTRHAAIESVHVAAYVEQLQKARSAPTAKLRLAALRHLFDWMVIGQIMPINPAAAVRGPRHIVRRGKTPVLDPAEARQLIDAINTSTVIGLRDRALVGLMVYSFARIGAAIGMRVEDVYPQNRRLWVRLHKKGGKQHAMPCHHNLETYLHVYIAGAGPRERPEGDTVPDLQPRDRPAHRPSPAPSERL